jgi:hypothetical protein
VPAKGTKFVPRAGKRKCVRCREVWYRERADKCTLCPRCQVHCFRCNVELTSETRSNPYRTASEAGRADTRINYICKACNNETSKFIRDNKGGKERNRDNHLIKTYGITAPEYDKMLKIQSGVCWICQQPPKEGGRRLSVDHLHSKGENKRNPREKRGRVRGLLCWHCNSALGGFNDDVTKLRRAADYLECWPAQKILNKEETDE